MGDTHSRNETREPFKVIIHRGELSQIEQWVRRHSDIETGGDLFGLWSKGNTAVVQLVLGPGTDSRRTAVSFFQDAEYLQKAGSHLTEQYGLCHIGEWHSHHTLGLAQPSGGDQSTVWSNMPNNGFKRFIVFIANIDQADRELSGRKRSRPAVGLGCFLFETKDTVNWERYQMMQGEFEVIDSPGPYRNLRALSDFIRKGAESINANSEVEVFSEKATGMHEGRNVLLSSREKLTAVGQRGYQQHSSNVASTSYLAKQTLPSIAKGTSAERRGEGQDGLQGAPFTVTIDALMHTNPNPLWDELDSRKQTFLRRLSREFGGRLVNEIYTVSIQFAVEISKLCHLACTLVYDDNALLLCISTLPSPSCEIELEKKISEQSIDSQVRYVKEEVKKHITENWNRLASYVSQPTLPEVPGHRQLSGSHSSAAPTAVTPTAQPSQPEGTSSKPNDSQSTFDMTGSNPGYREENASSSSDVCPMEVDEEEHHESLLKENSSHLQTAPQGHRASSHTDHQTTDLPSCQVPQSEDRGMQGEISQSHTPVGAGHPVGSASQTNATSQ